MHLGGIAMSERTVRPLELRTDGRRLSGTVLRYGSVSPAHQERFEPGSFDLSGGPPRYLDYRHNRFQVLVHEGAGLELRDTPEALTMIANLPALPLADVALSEIAAGRLSGLSIEYKPVRERQEGNLNVVEKAILRGIGLVESPSFRDSRVELRQSVGVITSTIPYDSRLACECRRDPGAAKCQNVVLAPGALNLPTADLLATWKDFGSPIGSTSKRTLKVNDTPEGLEIEIQIPDTSWGADILASAESAPIRVRPLFDAEDVDVERLTGADGVEFERLTRVEVQGILVGSTPNSDGWPEARVRGTPRPRSRSMYGWLL